MGRGGRRSHLQRREETPRPRAAAAPASDMSGSFFVGSTFAAAAFFLAGSSIATGSMQPTRSEKKAGEAPAPPASLGGGCVLPSSEEGVG